MRVAQRTVFCELRGTDLMLIVPCIIEHVAILAAGVEVLVHGHLVIAGVLVFSETALFPAGHIQ